MPKCKDCIFLDSDCYNTCRWVKRNEFNGEVEETGNMSDNAEGTCPNFIRRIPVKEKLQKFLSKFKKT